MPGPVCELGPSRAANHSVVLAASFDDVATSSVSDEPDFGVGALVDMMARPDAGGLLGCQVRVGAGARHRCRIKAWVPEPCGRRPLYGRVAA